MKFYKETVSDGLLQFTIAFVYDRRWKTMWYVNLFYIAHLHANAYIEYLRYYLIWY